jgi:hypothetical protein
LRNRGGGGGGMGGGRRSTDSGYQAVKGVKPQGSRTAATKLVALIRGGRLGYSPCPPELAEGLYPHSPA